MTKKLTCPKCKKSLDVIAVARATISSELVYAAEFDQYIPYVSIVSLEDFYCECGYQFKKEDIPINDRYFKVNVDLTRASLIIDKHSLAFDTKNIKEFERIIGKVTKSFKKGDHSISTLLKNVGQDPEEPQKEMEKLLKKLKEEKGGDTS